MPKTKNYFTADLALNPEKGGGWLLTCKLSDDNQVLSLDASAWKNASAAKRALKAIVQDKTPRKSIKLTAVKSDDNGKPVHLSGSLQFNA